MADPVLKWVREDQGGRTAIVFVHGFGSDSTKTWGRFPALVCGESALDGWDVAMMGYSTSLAPGLLEGLWIGGRR